MRGVELGSVERELESADEQRTDAAEQRRSTEVGAAQSPGLRCRLVSKAAIRLVDCTLRDGGYYTKWDVPRALVGRYLAAVGAAGVDVVELGMRSFPRREFLEPYAYTSDEYLESLNVPERLVGGVMVDATTVLKHDRGVAAAVASLFRRAEASPVAFVRIAPHFGDVELC